MDLPANIEPIGDLIEALSRRQTGLSNQHQELLILFRQIDTLRDYTRHIRMMYRNHARNRILQGASALFGCMISGYLMIHANRINLELSQSIGVHFQKYYIYISAFFGISTLGVIFSAFWYSMRSEYHDKMELERTVPRFEKLVSYLLQLHDQGNIDSHLKDEIDIRLVEAEHILRRVRQFRPKQK